MLLSSVPGDLGYQAIRFAWAGMGYSSESYGRGSGVATREFATQKIEACFLQPLPEFLPKDSAGTSGSVPVNDHQPSAKASFFKALAGTPYFAKRLRARHAMDIEFSWIHSETRCRNRND
jgi:hypothetical protein